MKHDKHDALIGHGGAQVGDETPLGFSLGSAEKCWLEAVSFYLQDLKQETSLWKKSTLGRLNLQPIS